MHTNLTHPAEPSSLTDHGMRFDDSMAVQLCHRQIDTDNACPCVLSPPLSLDHKLTEI